MVQSPFFFYGAGCGLAPKAAIVQEALDSILRPVQRSEVYGDILGAARSLLSHEAGIACILGTGANACLYDGRGVTACMPSLGYMFSDWGSGTVMSRDFIALLLQEKLPVFITDDFQSTYRLGRAEILDNIYNKPMPNRFLASFTPFLLKYAAVPELTAIIRDNFSRFFLYYVARFPVARDQMSVSFVGSVAHGFRRYLHEVADDLGIRIQKIVQHPMDGLVRFHSMKVPAGSGGI